MKINIYELQMQTVTRDEKKEIVHRGPTWSEVVGANSVADALAMVLPPSGGEILLLASHVIAADVTVSDNLQAPPTEEVAPEKKKNGKKSKDE